jgi:hypothetical protein
MMPTAVTRRAFLATSAGAVATLAVADCPGAVPADSRPEPAGVVYGRAGRRGIPPGTASAPSRGEVILLDGRVLEVSLGTSRGIGAGRSVLLSSDGTGGWSILYAEF